MSFIHTLGKETGKPPTAYFVRNLLNEADTLIASQVDVCFGHPIILLALLVQFLVPAVLKTIDLFCSFLHNRQATIRITLRLEVRDATLFKVGAEYPTRVNLCIVQPILVFDGMNLLVALLPLVDRYGQSAQNIMA